jgi:hypothetical protein
MHVVLIALVIGSHIAASGSRSSSMLAISSDWFGRSMKWLSIFAVGALEHFSRRKHWQAD